MTFFSNYSNLVLIAIIFISGGLLLWSSLSRSQFGAVSAPKATQLINRCNAVVVDLRPATEFAKGHLPSAHHIEFTELQAQLNQIAKNKNNVVLLVCQTGHQSRKAVRIVRDADYAKVYMLEGGLNAWQKAEMPIVK